MPRRHSNSYVEGRQQRGAPREAWSAPCRPNRAPTRRQPCWSGEGGLRAHSASLFLGPRPSATVPALLRLVIVRSSPSARVSRNTTARRRTPGPRRSLITARPGHPRRRRGSRGRTPLPQRASSLLRKRERATGAPIVRSGRSPGGSSPVVIRYRLAAPMMSSAMRLAAPAT